MTPAEAITAFAALFVVIDPIGLTPIFVALTAGMTPRARRAIAMRALGIAACLLVLFALAGEALLSGPGDLYAGLPHRGRTFAVPDGAGRCCSRGARSAARPRRNRPRTIPPTTRPVFPLALPLIAGPGAIATMILLTDGATTIEAAEAVGVMLAVLAVCLVMFQLAAPLERALGTVGTNVVTRLLGMLLAALSVQFVLDGLSAVW